MRERAGSRSTKAKGGKRSISPSINHDSFGYLIREANKNFSRVLQTLIEPYGITTAQWYFLRILWEEQGLTQAELSNRVGLMTATTVGALNTLEGKGLIERRPHPTDKRKFEVYLTKRGKMLESKLLPCGVEANKIAVAHLSPEIMRQTRVALKTMCTNLSLRLDPPQFLE
jgi:DNA-binding MarR family transcriptional regulator